MAQLSLLALFSVFSQASPAHAHHLVWREAHLPFLPPRQLADRYRPCDTPCSEVFSGATRAQAGFGNYFLPLQIGARECLPTLNLLAFWPQ